MDSQRLIPNVSAQHPPHSRAQSPRRQNLRIRRRTSSPTCLVLLAVDHDRTGAGDVRAAPSVDTVELDLAGTGESRGGVAGDGATVFDLTRAGEREAAGGTGTAVDVDIAGTGEHHLRLTPDGVDFDVAGANELEAETTRDGTRFEVTGAGEVHRHGTRGLDVGVGGTAHTQGQDAVGRTADADQTVEATESQCHPRRDGHDQEDLSVLVDLATVDDELAATVDGDRAAAGDDAAAAHDHGVTADAHAAAEDVAPEDVALPGRVAVGRTARLEGQPAGDRHVATTRVDGRLVEHLGVAEALDLDVLRPRVDGHGDLSEDVLEADAGDVRGARVIGDDEAGLHHRDITGFREITRFLDEQLGVGHVLTPRILEDGCIFCCECT